MKNRWFPPIAVLAVVIALSLIVLELGVRVIEPENVLREHFERSDPEFHHRFIAGKSGLHKSLEFNARYTINSMGCGNVRYRGKSRRAPSA